VRSEEDREAVPAEAFYLADPLLYAIDRKGSPRVFAINCLTALLNYGCLPGASISWRGG